MEAPKCGARCRPLMKPSTTWRASRSRLPMRASTLGSTNLAPGIAPDWSWRAIWVLGPVSRVLRVLHARLRQRHGLQEVIDQHVAGNALGLGAEVRQHAVAHDRMRQGFNVIETDVIAAARQCARLGAQDQVLRGADAGAERRVLFHGLWRVRGLR